MHLMNITNNFRFYNYQEIYYIIVFKNYIILIIFEGNKTTNSWEKGEGEEGFEGKSRFF